MEAKLLSGIFIFLLAGFTAGNNIASQETSPNAMIGKTCYVNSPEGLNMRSEPSTSSGRIAAFPDNYPVRVLGRTETMALVGGVRNYWYQVEADRKTGWVFGEYIRLEPKPFVQVKNIGGIVLTAPKEVIEKRTHAGTYRVLSLYNGGYDVSNPYTQVLSEISLKISYSANGIMNIICNLGSSIDESFSLTRYFPEDNSLYLVTADGPNGSLFLKIYFTGMGIFLHYQYTKFSGDNDEEEYYEIVSQYNLLMQKI